MEIIIAVLAVMVIGFVVMAVKMVPQGEEWTLERFGKYSRTLEPGIALIVPIVERVGGRFSRRETLLEVSPQEIISSDNAMVKIDGVAFYRIVQTDKAAYAVANIEQALENLVMTNMRNALGSLTLDKMLSDRTAINDAVMKSAQEAANEWGVKFTRIEIKDIQPPEDLVVAMNSQMKAERTKRAMILEAQGRQESAVLIAQGEKSAAFLAAEARERSAEADAKSTEILSTAIKEGDTEAVRYFLGVKYTEAMGQLAASNNSKVILMPAELTSMAGLMSGVAELYKGKKG